MASFLELYWEEIFGSRVYNLLSYSETCGNDSAPLIKECCENKTHFRAALLSPVIVASNTFEEYRHHEGFRVQLDRGSPVEHVPRA